MAAELPYLPSYKNVGTLFQKITEAKVPDSFTQKFLEDTIGLKSTSDRPLITLLRTLGLLDASGKPTPEYSRLKNSAQAPNVLAQAITRAYEPLFAANEKANMLPPDELKGLIAQVAGTDAGMTAKILGTFSALVKIADFSDPSVREGIGQQKEPEKGSQPSADDTALRPDFHYNIQVHLPSNGTEETYLNIFNAIRKVFR